MQFKIDLTRVRSLPELPLHHEEGVDDVRSLLGDLCGALADTASAEFIASGFGQQRWPVDVRTDLPVFLEQLPGAMASVESGVSFSLDFYEQGVERSVHFEPQGERYSALCESHTAWRPDPAIEMIDMIDLMKMFSEVRENLIQFLGREALRIAAHPWIRAWASATRD